MLMPVMIPAIVTAVEGYIVRQSVIVAVRDLLVVAIAGFAVVYTGRKKMTFTSSVCMMLLALISSVQAFIPDFIVPIAAFGVVLAFIASPMIGITSVVYFAAMPFLVTERSFEYFLFIALMGIIGISLIYGCSRTGRYVEALLIYTLVYTLLYPALIVMKRMTIEPELVIDPVVGLVLSIVIMEVAGYRFYNNVIKRREDLYKTVVDPEHPLLIELKNSNKTEYKRAIHTAHFTDLFAEKFGYNRILMKGLGFYHRIGVLSKEDTSIAVRTVKLAVNEGFPEDIIDAWKEYGEVRPGNKVSAEVAITVIVDSVICDLMKEFAKGNDKPDLNKFIDKSILRLFSGQNSLLKKSAIPYSDLEDIRKHLKTERIYYDFLR